MDESSRQPFGRHRLHGLGVPTGTVISSRRPIRGVPEIVGDVSENLDHPLKILVLNWQDRENPQAGGAEEHIHQVFGRMAARGHGVTLLASGFRGCSSRAMLDGMEVCRSGGRHTFSLAAPGFFERNLRHRQWDVVVDCINKVPLYSTLWAQAPVVALVHHLFGATAFREASVPVAAATWLLEKPLPLAYRGCPTIAISNGTRDDLVARGLRARIVVIPVGVDTGHYTPDPQGLKTASPTLLYLGRIKRYKGIDLLVRAVAALAERIDLRFRIAGSGDWRPSLERLARELRVEDRVDFLGFVDDDRKMELMRTSWIHGLTSPKEGWGITNLEAGACGTPSVTSDSPGLRESVRHGETGLVVPHGDVEALAEAIRRLITDDDLRQRLGQGARMYAESLSWTASSDAVERFIGETIARDGRGRRQPR